MRTQSKTTVGDVSNSSKPISFIKAFLWLCSGADVEILSQKDCETEGNKYASIGATLFLTAVMAFFVGKLRSLYCF